MQNIPNELKDGQIIPAVISVPQRNTNQFRHETPRLEEEHKIMRQLGSWFYAEKKQSNGMHVPIDENDIIKFLPKEEDGLE